MNNSLFNYLPVDDNSGLGIPFRSREGSRGLMEYFDLKRNPDLIPTVKELKDRPELQNFVTELNKPASIFRTLRCEFRCTCNHANGTLWQTHWHFTFAFDIVDQNQAENYDAFNDLLEAAMIAGQRGRNIAFDLRKVHNSYLDHGVTSWSEDIEVYGIASSQEASESEFLYALRLLRNFFYSESKTWFGKLAPGRGMIS